MQSSFEVVSNLSEISTLFSISLDHKKRWIQKMFIPQKIDPNNVGPKRNLVPKNFVKKKLRPQKNCLVKIGSVTVEIFMIWTNVNRINVPWTNVTVQVGII